MINPTLGHIKKLRKLALEEFRQTTKELPYIKIEIMLSYQENMPSIVPMPSNAELNVPKIKIKDT